MKRVLVKKDGLLLLKNKNNIIKGALKKGPATITKVVEKECRILWPLVGGEGLVGRSKHCEVTVKVIAWHSAGCFQQVQKLRN